MTTQKKIVVNLTFVQKTESLPWGRSTELDKSTFYQGISEKQKTATKTQHLLHAQGSRRPSLGGLCSGTLLAFLVIVQALVYQNH